MTPQTPAEPIRLYSHVVDNGLILPRKVRYSKRDVDRVLLDSLMRGPRTLTLGEARFVIRCSAIYHDTDYSPACRNPKPSIRGIVG